MKKTVSAFLDRQAALVPGALVLCAVSGGRDSMVLLHLLRELAEERGLRLAAAHFNHRLRPTADRDEAFVRDWCRAREIPFTCGRGDAGAFARREGLGVEEAARTLRYAFLEAAARDMGAACVATAHHREDNAETVLLNLLRGTGLRGLGGIPPARGRILRPLLEVGREDIDAYAASCGVPYMEDETNADPAYTRNRLRLEVLPLLEEISPGCGKRIAAAGALLREEEEYLQRAAERSAAVSYGVDSVTLSGIWDGGAVTGRRLIRSAARRFGVELDRRMTENVWNLSGGGYLNLPGGLCALRTGGQLTVRKTPELPGPMALQSGEQVWGPWRVRLTRGPAPAEEARGTLYLRPEAGTLTIAAWDGRGRLAVENGSRTIKRLFADQGIPVQRRWEHPALYREDGGPAAVFGVAVDRALRPEPGEDCWMISLTPCKIRKF